VGDRDGSWNSEFRRVPGLDTTPPFIKGLADTGRNRPRLDGGQPRFKLPSSHQGSSSTPRREWVCGWKTARGLELGGLAMLELLGFLLELEFQRPRPLCMPLASSLSRHNRFHSFLEDILRAWSELR